MRRRAHRGAATGAALSLATGLLLGGCGVGGGQPQTTGTPDAAVAPAESPAATAAAPAATAAAADADAAAEFGRALDSAEQILQSVEQEMAQDGEE